MNLRQHMAGGLLLLALSAAHAQNAMLRIACDDDSVGADIVVNGKSMGDCPFDMAVKPGTIVLKATKKVDAGRERVFEQEFRVGDGVVKRIEIVLGQPRFTPEGERMEAERIRREQAEAQRREEERRRIAAEKERAQRDKLMAESERLLAQWRAKRQSVGVPGCPDCPGPVPSTLDAAGLQLPQLSDPVLAGWLQQARAEMQAYLSNPNNFLPPANAAAWPCAVDETMLRKLAGDVDSSDWSEKEKKKVRDAAQGADFQMFSRDLHFWPVQASCRDGRLDGALEVWMYSIRGTSYNGNLTLTPSLKKISAMLADGKPSGVVRIVSRSGEGITFASVGQMGSGKPRAATESWMTAYRYAVPEEDPHALLLSMINTEDQELAQSAVWQTGAAGPSLHVTRPVGAGRIEMTSYQGMRKASLSYMRNGVNHGETTIYGYTIPGGFLLKDMVIPTSSTCYRDGTVVQMNPCRVD